MGANVSTAPTLAPTHVNDLSYISGGEDTPTAPFPLSPSSYQRQSPRPFHRPPFRGGSGRGSYTGQPRPYLSRGRSLDHHGITPGGGVVSSSISFHNPPVTSNVATPIRSTFIEGMARSSAETSNPIRIPIESMSAPEDAYHEVTPSTLYPRVLVSDSEARDICLPLSDSAHIGGMAASAADMNRLMDPRYTQLLIKF